jgi:hypothetical protein
MSKGVQCTKCLKKYCRKCFGQLKDQKRNRYCDECITSGSVSIPSQRSEIRRQNVLDVPAQGDEIIKASYVQLKGPGGRTMNRYFVLRKNFCLYSYTNKEVSKISILIYIIFRTMSRFVCCQFPGVRLDHLMKSSHLRFGTCDVLIMYI